MASIAPDLARSPSPGGRRVGLLAGAGELLVTAGTLVLLFAAWQLWWTDLGAGRQADRLTAQLRAAWVAGAMPPDSEPPTGAAFAVLHIPRFGPDWHRPVLEGTSPRELDRGVGHYRGTALPGQLGNLAIAGHRTTYGRPLRDVDRLETGDEIVLETPLHWYTYRVVGHQVVAPGASHVVAANPDDPEAKPVRAMLTLTTCHPVYSAQRRWVVHAVLDTIRAR